VELLQSAKQQVARSSTATYGMQMEYEIPDVALLIRAMLAAVCLTSSMGSRTERVSSAFVLCRKAFAVRRNWNHALRSTATLPMRISLLRQAIHLHLTPYDVRAEIHFGAERLFCC
jgi:hypothetical protein